MTEECGVGVGGRGETVSGGTTMLHGVNKLDKTDTVCAVFRTWQRDERCRSAQEPPFGNP